MRPILWLAAGACCALALALGAWQWGRMQEKEALFAAIAARAGEPALAATAISEDPALEFRTVRATVDAAPTIALFGARTRTFQRARLEDGRLLLAETGVAGAGLKADMVFEGVLRRFSLDAALPRDEPAAGRFYQPGPALSESLGAPREAVWYLAAKRLATPSGADFANTGADPRKSLPGPERHLGYALTWFALAVSVLVIAALLNRRLARSTVARA